MAGESRRRDRVARRDQSQGRSSRIMYIYGHFMDGVEVFDAFVAVSSLARTQAQYFRGRDECVYEYHRYLSSTVSIVQSI